MGPPGMDFATSQELSRTCRRELSEADPQTAAPYLDLDSILYTNRPFARWRRPTTSRYRRRGRGCGRWDGLAGGNGKGRLESYEESGLKPSGPMSAVNAFPRQ